MIVKNLNTKEVGHTVSSKHFESIDSQLNKALEDNDDLKDNAAYREVLKAMLTVDNKNEGKLEQNTEELDEKSENLSDQKSTTETTTSTTNLSGNNTILNEQLQKLFNFCNNETLKFDDIFVQNAKQGKNGLGAVLGDLKKEVESMMNKDVHITKHFLEISQILTKYPKVIHYAHLVDENFAKKISEQNLRENELKTEIDVSTKILNKQQEQNEELQKRKDEREVERKYEFVVDETDDVRNTLQAILDSIPNCLTNEDIKIISHQYIDELNKYLDRTRSDLKQDETEFRSKLEKFKKYLNFGKNLNLEDLKDLVYIVHFNLEEDLKKLMTKTGKEDLKKKLTDAKNSLTEFQTELNRSPLKTLPKQDTNELIDTIK